MENDFFAWQDATNKNTLIGDNTSTKKTQQEDSFAEEVSKKQVSFTDTNPKFSIFQLGVW